MRYNTGKSMDSKLALGAHVGQSEPVPVAPHEYCYCDDANEVLCRCEIRQVGKTAVDATRKYLLA